MDKFLILRLSSLGDIIHTLPAYAALRKNFPHSEISWLVEDKGKEILDLVPGLDRIYVLSSEKWPVLSKKFWRQIRRISGEINEKKRTALDFQGLIKSGLFAFLSRARRRIGFHKTNLREGGASVFYTEHADPTDESEHVIVKNLNLLKKIGIEEKSFDFPLDVPESAVRNVIEKTGLQGLPENERLVLLNVGAAWETKRWFTNNWIELIGKLKNKRKDLRPLLLWGNETEEEIAAAIERETRVKKVPRLTIKEVVALVKRADLLVSGDTFALQAACALGRPAVGLFGPSNPGRNGPFNEQDAVAFHKLECSFCYKRTCPSLECLKQITPEEVTELCLRRLETNG
jgi:heptosyltransferase-1